jgi:MFS family permease
MRTILTILRVLVGFVVACLAGALTTLLFVHTPEEVVTWLTSLPPEDRGQRFSVFGLLWLAAATQSAVFSALFAFVAAVVAEWRGVRAWTYYAIVGILIALLGFGAQWLTEPTGQNWSVVNSHYPFVAFLTTGFVAGFVYWMVAGRHAGGVPKALPSPIADAPKPVAKETPKTDTPGPVTTGSEAEAAPKP